VTEIELRALDDSAVFDLADGARLTRLVLGGRSLVVPRGDREPMWWGAFMMAPWTSLLRGGDFTFAGRHHRVAPAESEEAWHGVVHAVPWALDAATRHELAASSGLGPPWPLGGRAEVSARLVPAALELTLRVRAGAERMPAAIGWHPWFVRRLDDVDVQVRVPGGARVQLRDADGAPTGGWADASGRAGSWNDCVRTDGPVDLDYGPVGRLRISSSSEYATLFTEAPDGVCVEPVTSPAEQMDDVVDPGEAVELRIRLEWQPA
jgi:aldose 1-epimerase